MSYGRRPPELTAVAFLVWGEGLLYVVAGTIILMNLGDETLVDRAGGVDLAIPVAFASFAVSLLFIGASAGLLRGSPSARIVTTVLLGISLIVAVYVISGGARVLGGGLIAALAVIGLVLLWLPRPSRYFAGG